MELHIAGQLRRGPPGLSALLPGMLIAVVLACAQDQARGQGFVVQAGTVGPSHRDEPSDRRGPYLPLYAFCGRHLLLARQRRANVAGSAGAVEEVARIVARIRGKWRKVRIVLRADSGFANEEAV